MKHTHSILSLLTAVSLLLMTGCANEPAQKAPEKTEAAAETEKASAEDVKEEAKAETAAAEKPLRPIRMSIETSSESYYDRDSYATKAETSFIRFHLSDEEKKAYPALAETFETWNRASADLNESATKELLSSFEELKSAGAIPENDYSFRLRDSVESAEALRADTSAISIHTFHTDYYGGVHGGYAYIGYNFDTESGREMSIGDLVTDVPRFLELVQEHVDQDYAELRNEMGFYSDYFSAVSKDPSLLCWDFDYTGVNLYFNPYDLGAYAIGAQTVFIPFSEDASLFNAKYRKTPESFSRFVPMDMALPVEVSDGSHKLLKVTQTEKPDGSYYMQYTVTYGDKTAVVDNGSFSASCYLVLKNNHHLLYFFESAENDYGILSILDLDTMTLDQNRILGASLSGADSHWSYDGEKNFYSVKVPVFNDPNSFILSTGTDFLSTMRGTKNYTTDADGYPVTLDPWYQCHTNVILKTKNDIACHVVDETGKDLGTEVIPSGTYLLFVRTDNVSWGDFQIFTGEKTEENLYDDYYSIYAKESAVYVPGRKLYRIHEDKSSWPFTVNGAPEDKVFSGIMYAG